MAHLIWAGVLLFLVVRTEAVVRHWLTLRYPARSIEVHEVEVPADILAVAMRESEEWAQEEVVKAARERYAKLTDTSVSEEQKWNLVRRAIGIGEMG